LSWILKEHAKMISIPASLYLLGGSRDRTASSVTRSRSVVTLSVLTKETISTNRNPELSLTASAVWSFSIESLSSTVLPALKRLYVRALN
jgi:hypothetical protein